MTARLTLLTLTCILLLAACGGGGGSGGTGSTSSGGTGSSSSSTSSSSTSSTSSGGTGSNITFVVPTGISQSADAGTGQNPTQQFEVTLSAPLTDDVHAGYGFTRNGVVQVAFFFATPTQYRGIVYFADPTDIGPGVYTDTITVGICTTSDCTALRSGTVRNIPITYTITGNLPPPVSASTSTPAIQVEAQLFTGVAPVAYVDLAYQNVRANNSVDVTPTVTHYDYVAGLAYERISETQGRVRVQFKNVAQMSPGTYEQAVTISVCQANKCPTNVAGSPITVTARYVVSNSVAGPNGYTIRSIAQPAVDASWDAASAKLYVGVPAQASQNANCIVSIDPVTGATAWISTLGGPPLHVRTSDDGQFAYVVVDNAGAVKRFSLPTLLPSLEIPVGSDADGQLAGYYLEVAPGASQTFALVRQRPFPNGNPVSVAIYDGAVMRPNVLALAQMRSLQWNGASSIFAASGGQPLNLATLQLDANGVVSTTNQTIPTTTTSGGFESFALSAGSLYFDRGDIFDTATNALTVYQPPDAPTSGAPRVVGTAVDGVLNRGFAVVNESFDWTLQSFDLTTQQQIASLPLAGITFRQNRTNPILRWGTDGLALITDDGRIVVVQGKFVAP